MFSGLALQLGGGAGVRVCPDGYFPKMGNPGGYPPARGGARGAVVCMPPGITPLRGFPIRESWWGTLEEAALRRSHSPAALAGSLLPSPRPRTYHPIHSPAMVTAGRKGFIFNKTKQTIDLLSLVT